MKLVKDYIKSLYINMGYLPNFPIHLTSDKEMFSAFLRHDGVFADYYPCPDESFQEAYDALFAYISAKIASYQKGEIELPKWIYSYMMLVPVSFDSDQLDIYDLTVLCNIEIEGETLFDSELADACYKISKQWLAKIPSRYQDRPPTMFGENHVIKSLRLDQANVLVGAGGGS